MLNEGPSLGQVSRPIPPGLTELGHVGRVCSPDPGMATLFLRPPDHQGKGAPGPHVVASSSGEWGMFMWNPDPSLHSESVLTQEALQLQIPKGSEEDERQRGGAQTWTSLASFR